MREQENYRILHQKGDMKVRHEAFGTEPEPQIIRKRREKPLSVCRQIGWL